MLDCLIATNIGNPLNGCINYEDFATSCMIGAVTNELQGLYFPNIRLHFPDKELIYRSCPGIGAVSLLKDYTKELVLKARNEKEPLIAFIATYKNNGDITVVCVEKDAKDAIVMVRDSNTERTTIKRDEFSNLDEALEPLIKELVTFTSLKKECDEFEEKSAKYEIESSLPKIKTSSSSIFVKKIKHLFNK